MDFLTSVARRQVEPGSGIRPRSPSRFAPTTVLPGDTAELIELSTETPAPRPRSSTPGIEKPTPAPTRAAVAPRMPDQVSSERDRPAADPSDSTSRPAAPSQDEAVAVARTVAAQLPVESKRPADESKESANGPVMPESRRPEHDYSDIFDGGHRRGPLSTVGATPEAKTPEASYLPLVKVVPPSRSDGTRVTRATQPVERIRRPETEAPVVTVTIGRVEVRAVSASAPSAAPTTARSSPRATTLSLEDYLERRHGTAHR